MDVYFERVQPFLPLLHRPRLLSLLQKESVRGNDRYRDLDVNTILLLHGLFALAARFSHRNDFWTSAYHLRGEVFASRARSLLGLSAWEEHDRFDLRYLQGCILLTYYDTTVKPSFQAWAEIGRCCRIAYAMFLHQIDRDADDMASSEDWTDMEERRRAWWVIVQLDSLASIVAGRPFAISMEWSKVLLPVSDEAWFGLKPTRSAFVSGTGSVTAWDNLRDFKVEDPYAWSLVVNQFLRQAHEEIEKPCRLPDSLRILERSMHCCVLSLPRQLRLSGENLIFEQRNVREKSWYIYLHLLLQRFA